MQRRPLRLTLRDKVADAVQLHRIDDGADIGGLVQGVADAQLAQPRLQPVLERRGDGFLHQNPRPRAADLPLIEPDRIHHAFHRRIQIGIGENDEGRLAAQFQRQLLARPGGRLADRAADLGRSGEGDLVHLCRDQRRAGFTVAGHDVDDTFGQPDLGADLCKGERRQGRVFGRLQHHGIARRQRGRDLPGEHQKGKVPRDDLAADADRPGARKLLGQHLGPAGMVVEMPRHQRHVDVAAFTDRLAVVERFKHGKEAFAFLDVAGKRVKPLRPFMARKPAPAGLCRAGGLHRPGHVPGASRRHLGQHLARRGVRRGEGLAGLREGPVDEMAKGSARLQPGPHLARCLGGRAILHRLQDLCHAGHPGSLSINLFRPGGPDGPPDDHASAWREEAA